MNDFVGIDVSKNMLDIYSLQQKSSWQVVNTPEGHTELVLALLDVQHVVVEATGGYQKSVVQVLRKAGISVFVANPRRIRRFADGIGKLAKTDKLDAQVLAHYAFSLQINTKAQTVPTETQERLKDLNTHRQGLVEQIAACKIRRKQTQDAVILEQLQTLLNTLKQLEKALRKEISECIQGDQSLKEKLELLTV